MKTLLFFILLSVSMTCRGSATDTGYNYYASMLDKQARYFATLSCHSDTAEEFLKTFEEVVDLLPKVMQYKASLTFNFRQYKGPEGGNLFEVDSLPGRPLRWVSAEYPYCSSSGYTTTVIQWPSPDTLSPMMKLDIVDIGGSIAFYQLEDTLLLKESRMQDEMNLLPVFNYQLCKFKDNQL